MVSPGESSTSVEGEVQNRCVCGPNNFMVIFLDENTHARYQVVWLSPQIGERNDVHCVYFYAPSLQRRTFRSWRLEFHTFQDRGMHRPIVQLYLTKTMRKHHLVSAPS